MNTIFMNLLTETIFSSHKLYCGYATSPTCFPNNIHVEIRRQNPFRGMALQLSFMLNFDFQVTFQETELCFQFWCLLLFYVFPKNVGFLR